MNGLSSRHALYVLASLTALHMCFLCLWYVSSPTGPLAATAEWSIVARRYWMFPASALYGLIVGFVVHRAYLAWTTILLAVLVVCGAFVHFAAGQIGIAVDWASPQGVIAGAVIGFVIYVPVGLLGSVVGHKLSAVDVCNES